MPTTPAEDDLRHYRAAGAPPRIVRRAQAIELGFSERAIERRLSEGRWQRVLPKTYLTSNVLTWPDRLYAATAFAGPDAVLTGAAALADLGLRTVQRPSQLLVLVPRSTGLRSTEWVRIRRTDRMPARARVDGPPRAQLARAVADLALERPWLDDVTALVAQAVRAKLCTLDELAVELAQGPRRGSRNLRIALADVGAGAWSAPEARAARILRGAKVPLFEQNARIDLPGGRYFIADFLWRALRAVLEIDSDQHHFLNPADRDATSEKSSTLQTHGFSVMSRRPATLRSEARFRRDVEAWLAGRARELAS